MILATLCYIRKNGKVLMLHRTKKKSDIHQGKWVGLGGKFEKGETPDKCVMREVKEESGLTPKNLTFHGTILFDSFKGNDWFVFIYSATDYKGTITESSEGKLAWINETELLTLELWEDDKIFLPWILEGKLFSAKFDDTKEKHTLESVTFYKQ